MTKIKICGLSRVSDIECVNEYLPDYIGFMFYKKSIRCVSTEIASNLKSILNESIIATGVFVDAKTDFILKLINDNVIDAVQLHGNESEEYIKELKSLTDKPVIKAFKVSDKSDVTRANKSSADYILLDNGNGGTGESFEWEYLNFVDREYFLAGGLDCSNVSNAIKKYKPYGVDVSSGVETNKVKDNDKIIEFISQVRREKYE